MANRKPGKVVALRLEPLLAWKVSRIVARYQLDYRQRYSKKRYIEDCVRRCIERDYAIAYPNGDTETSDKPAT